MLTNDTLMVSIGFSNAMGLTNVRLQPHHLIDAAGDELSLQVSMVELSVLSYLLLLPPQSQEVHLLMPTCDLHICEYRPVFTC